MEFDFSDRILFYKLKIDMNFYSTHIDFFLIFAPEKWSRSLMDRIKDSGSFGLGSNPSGITVSYHL